MVYKIFNNVTEELHCHSGQNSEKKQITKNEMDYKTVLDTPEYYLRKQVSCGLGLSKKIYVKAGMVKLHHYLMKKFILYTKMK